MDQNRIPSSSPMQHHNKPCGRPTSSSSADPNAPSSIPRPSSTHQSPTVQPNTIPAGSNWSSSAPWPEDEAGQSVASSSRLPSTIFPGDEAVAQDDAYSRSALLTSEPLNRSSSTQPSPNLSSALPSAAPSPSPIPGQLSGPTAVTGKRRNRAASLPTAEPIFKRRRFAADVPTPSEEFARTFATRRRDSSRLAVQQARARDLGARLLAGRQLKGGCRAGEQIIVASHQPPINIKTLRSLDAHEILKQPQLRHDLLFDTLAFRPINSSSSTYSDTIMSGTEMATLPPETRGVCTVTDMYWESIEMEITTGCRCTRWQIPVGMQLDAKGIKGKERMAECVCGKWRSDLSEADWWEFQKSRMWASRLPELIKALREILISLMGSTTPCPNHFAHSFSREALDLHELTCPTVTHALVPQLYEALDPEFLTRRVRRQAFDLSLFEMLGEAMKVHCAPIRDGLVDEMVRTAMGTGAARASVAQGLRKCFDCVEIMKLDIANHQVHALRPYLWSCATQYELNAFKTHLISTSTLLPSSRTRAWMRASSLRVLSRAGPKERLHLLGTCPCRHGDKTELVLRAAADGFTGLVFANQAWKAGDRWQPFLDHKKGKKAAPCSVEHVPESLRMDIRRISSFHSEAVELTIIHILILACRDLLPSIHPELSAKASRKHLDGIVADLDLMVPNSPLCAGETGDEVALQLAGRIVRLDPEARISTPFSEAEHAQLERLTEQLTKYISTQVRPESAIFCHSFRRLEEVVRVMLTHELLKLEGEMTVEAGKSGAGAACEAMTSGPEEEDEEDDTLSSDEDIEVDLDTGAIIPPAAIIPPLPATAGTPPERTDSVQVRLRSRAVREQQRAEEKRLARLYGLDIVFGEMKSLVKRMERIAGFNVGVFRGVYGEAGMVVGA